MKKDIFTFTAANVKKMCWELINSYTNQKCLNQSDNWYADFNNWFENNRKRFENKNEILSEEEIKQITN